MVIPIMVLISVLMVCATIAVMHFKIVKPLRVQRQELMAALEGKKISDDQRIQDKSEPGRKDATEPLFDGIVSKDTITVKGRRMSNYRTTERMPNFEDVHEALGWGLGITSQVQDPTIFNLAGYGPVCQTDQLIAFRLVINDVFQQIKALAPLEKDSETFHFLNRIENTLWDDGSNVELLSQITGIMNEARDYYKAKGRPFGRDTSKGDEEKTE